MRTVRFTRMIAAALVVTAGMAVLAPPASSLPPAGSDPPDTTDRPDLKVTALSANPSGSAWSIAYTVANAGALGAGSSNLMLGGGPGLSVSVPIPSLAAGASRSGTVQVTRADCYVYVSATADSNKVVTEISETNNARATIGAVPGCPPRYKVSAAHFKAIDESGDDRAGSDEVYWTFSSVSNTDTAATRNTQVYGSMDTDDTQPFSVIDGCIWGCSPVGAPAAFGIGMSIQAFEQDQGDLPDIVSDVADAFQAVGPILSQTESLKWAGEASTKIGDAIEFFVGAWEDDTLGSNTYAYSPEGLASALPNRGTSFLDTRLFEKDGAKYSLTLVVSRPV